MRFHAKFGGIGQTGGKMAEPIEMPFSEEGLTHAGLRNHVLDGGMIGQIQSQPQGVTRRRCGLLPNYFGHSLSYLLTYRYLCLHSAFVLTRLIRRQNEHREDSLKQNHHRLLKIVVSNAREATY